MSETYEAVERERNKLRNDLAATKQKLVTIEQNAQDEIDRLNEQNYAQSIKLEAAQLHIKELLDFIDATKVWFSTETIIGKGLHDRAELLLAKQPNTRALDKALLEARIDALDNVSIWGGGESDIDDFAEKYKAKLAELNM